MKQLSIEQKAKAYDEAYKKVAVRFGSNVADEIFLKESEDERTRKEILDYIIKGSESPYDVQQYGKEKFEKWIAWIEKQGEKILANSAKSCKDERKPDDKIESKFKIGDWVVYNDNVYQIHNISLEKYYECLRTDGTVHTFDFEYIDSKSYLWTIQDAKDGDVLVASDGSIFLFKGAINCACKHYVALTTDGDVIFNKSLEHYWEVSTEVHPATKEQRDLLFQKMYEAGYEWDVEKKELKKIKQPVKEYNITGIGSKNAQGKLGEMIKNLKPVNEVLKQKPWNEKDDAMFNFIALILRNHQSDEDFTTFETTFKDCIDWFKNLKDRIQPKQEWSKEDEIKIKSIIAFLESPALCCMEGNRGIINENIKYLKSLKNRISPQNIIYYSPYKEAIESIAEMCKHYVKASPRGLQDFYDNVRIKCKDAKEYDSFFPQNIWKPSEEQMDTLEYYMLTLACNEHKEVLVGLYTDLNKLREK